MRSCPIVLIFLIFNACEKPPHAAGDFCSQMLDEIVTRNGIYVCASEEVPVETEEEWNTMYDNFISGDIDSLEFEEYEMELSENVKQRDTCVFDLSDRFSVYSRVPRGFDPDVLASIRHIVKQLGEDFQQPDSVIVNLLVSPLGLKSGDFKVDYIQLVPFADSGKGYYGDMKGNGIFSFSKAVFNNRRDKAILFYEYVCGGKCGRGVIAHFQLADGHWKLKDEQHLWDT